MIDTKELRRLAQAATPGPWKLRPVGDRAKRFAVADINFLSVLTVVYECGTNFGAVYLDGDAKFIAAANPAAVSELLDRLEAAEKERDFAKVEIARLHDDIRELTDVRVLDEEDRELWTTLKAKSAEKENAKLREALVEKVVSETMLRDLSIRGGSIHASFEGGAMHLLVDAFVEQFVESGATNYLEMQFHSNVTGPLVVTLQRVNGKTAHQFRKEAEKARDTLRAKVSDLTINVEYLGNLKKSYEELIEELQGERDALLARIEAMERQEPFDADSDVFRSAFEEALKAGNWPMTRQGDGYRSPSTQIAWRIAFSTVNRMNLYLAPGAKGG